MPSFDITRLTPWRLSFVLRSAVAPPEAPLEFGKAPVMTVLQAQVTE